MRMSDWSSDVCSSDLSSVSLDSAFEDHRLIPFLDVGGGGGTAAITLLKGVHRDLAVMAGVLLTAHGARPCRSAVARGGLRGGVAARSIERIPRRRAALGGGLAEAAGARRTRSEEHTSALPSLMRLSYAVF